MEDFLFTGIVALVFILLGAWAVQRLRQQQRRAVERERAALSGLAAMPAGRRAPAAQLPAEAVDFDPTEPAARGGIEVAEMPDVVDLEALLSSMPSRVAEAARDVLDQPTGIGAAPAAPSTSIQASSQPLNPSPPSRSVPDRAPAVRSGPPPRPTLSSLISRAPLRELVLTWYRARGYQASPASVALRPIEYVLRHRSDAARTYAVVCEKNDLSLAQVDEWLRRAQSVGLGRLLIIAEAGVEAAALARKGVRILDRARIETEMRRLDPQLAARIIALVSSGLRPAAEPALGRV